MNKILVRSLLAIFFYASAVTAQAMPLAPLGLKDRAAAIPIADGCGFNRYRDARGICRKKYVITRQQGRQPFYTGCGGLNSHRVCNLYGHCWMVCD